MVTLPLFKRNEDIRQAKGKIPMWVVAERLDISENTFLNWMKKEMDGEKKDRVMSAIAEIKKEFEEYGVDVNKITKDSRPAIC